MDMERIARDIVFGNNVSNADAVLLWERLTGFRPRQAKRCERCGGRGHILLGRIVRVCGECQNTGYVGGFTPRDAEGQVGAMVEAVNRKGITNAND